MKKYLLLTWSILSLFDTAGQNALYTRNIPGPAIELKWYTQQLITAEGVEVYRKTQETDWIKISTKPVLSGGHIPSKEEVAQDPELQKYLELLKAEKNPKDLLLLATVIKSFGSAPLSRYLGIQFIDSTTTTGSIYTYKIKKRGTETELATSDPITCGGYQPIAAPGDISFKTGSQTIFFKWKPEPQRYYGMNIFRKTVDEKEFKKINRDPIILSGHQDTSNSNSRWYFEDKTVQTGLHYYYQFEALDFFGSPSVHSPPMLIYLKDRKFPLSPDSIWGVPAGKKNAIHWKKFSPENDLIGFNVYRTTKNDTDYKKLNESIIPSDQRIFNDLVPDFGSYMYMVSCIDKDSNETKSNGVFIKVFDNEPPAVPVNIRISADSGRITLRWQSNTEKDLKGYYIYRTINGDDKNRYVKLTPTTYTQTEFQDRLPVNAKNRFLYKICAVDESLNRSEYSEAVGIRMPDIVPPSQPFLKTVVFNEKDNPVLEWFSNAEPDLASYEIIRRKSGDDLQPFDRINSRPISTEVNKFTDRHASPGVYDYALIAIDSSGNRSTMSNVICFKVRAKNQEQSCSLEFTGMYNQKQEKVELKWKTETNGELRGFVLFRVEDQETSMIPLTGCVNTLAFLDHRVAKNATYTYQVRAYLSNGDVFHSKSLTITTK